MINTRERTLRVEQGVELNSEPGQRSHVKRETPFDPRRDCRGQVGTAVSVRVETVGSPRRKTSEQHS